MGERDYVLVPAEDLMHDPVRFFLARRRDSPLLTSALVTAPRTWGAITWE